MSASTARSRLAALVELPDRQVAAGQLRALETNPRRGARGLGQREGALVVLERLGVAPQESDRGRDGVLRLRLPADIIGRRLNVESPPVVLERLFGMAVRALRPAETGQRPRQRGALAFADSNSSTARNVFSTACA